MERARCIVPKEEDLVREANKRPNNEPNGLTNAEILMIVNGWIGGEGGYLGRFSYRTHNEFWLSNCDLYVDTNQYKGTTRQLFTETLSSTTSYHQADAIEALLEEYDGARDEEQNQLSRVQLVSIMNRLRSGSLPDSFDPGEGFVAVARAIDDAATDKRTRWISERGRPYAYRPSRLPTSNSRRLRPRLGFSGRYCRLLEEPCRRTSSICKSGSASSGNSYSPEEHDLIHRNPNSNPQQCLECTPQ